jgi:hypothetical protein
MAGHGVGAVGGLANHVDVIFQLQQLHNSLAHQGWSSTTRTLYFISSIRRLLLGWWERSGVCGCPRGRFTDGQLAAQFAGAFIHDAETVVIHRRACAPYSNTIVCNLNLDVTISQGLTANVNVPRAGMLDGIEHCLTDQLQDVDVLPRFGRCPSVRTGA